MFSAASSALAAMPASATARPTRMSLSTAGCMRTSYRRSSSGPDEHAHVADVRRDRDADGGAVGKRRGVGLVADVRLREVAGARSPSSRGACTDGCCSRAAPASSPRSFSAAITASATVVRRRVSTREEARQRQHAGAGASAASRAVASARRHRLRAPRTASAGRPRRRGGTRCSAPIVFVGS